MKKYEPRLTRFFEAWQRQAERAEAEKIRASREKLHRFFLAFREHHGTAKTCFIDLTKHHS